MSESICITLDNFTTEQVFPVERREGAPNKVRVVSLEVKLSFDGESYYVEEAWLDSSIDFYTIAERYNFLDKLLEEALTQLKKDKELASLQDKVTALEFETSLY